MEEEEYDLGTGLTVITIVMVKRFLNKFKKKQKSPTVVKENRVLLNGRNVYYSKVNVQIKDSIEISTLDKVRI